MAANAQEEQQWIDGTHPALAGNSVPRSSSPTRSVSPTPSASSSSSSPSPRFDAMDPSPPPAQPAPVRKGGASNTGPKGVLADWAARQATNGGVGAASNTGPKGVLNDWRGSQAASAEAALKNLSLGFVSSNGTVVRLDQEEDPLSDDEEVEGGDEEQAREKYRARRLLELQGSGERGGVSGPGVRRRHFGHLREIGMEQFLNAVEDEEEDVAVVLHLYEPEIEACAVLNQHLSSIARSYPQTKFIRALATEVDFSADMEEDTLPTMLVYRGGDLETTLVRPDLEWGRGTRADVVQLLQRYEAVSGVAVVPLNTSTARRNVDSDSGDDD